MTALDVDTSLILVLVALDDRGAVVREANPAAAATDPRLRPGCRLDDLEYPDTLAALAELRTGATAAHRRTTWHNGLREEPFDLLALRQGDAVLICYQPALGDDRTRAELLRNDAVLDAIRKTAFNGIVVADPVVGPSGGLEDLLVIWASRAAQAVDPRLGPGCSFASLYGARGTLLAALAAGRATDQEVLDWVDGAGTRRRFLTQANRAGERWVLEFQEMTAELDALDALAEANRHLAHAQALARLGSWELEVGADELRVTAEVLRILGLPADGDRHPLPLFEAAVHPADRQRVRTAIRRAEAPGGRIAERFRIVPPGGQERVVVAQGEHVQDPGRPPRIVGTLGDVTEADRAQRILAEEEARFRRLAEQLPDVVLQLRLRPDPDLLYASPHTGQVLGVPAHEVTWPLGELDALDPHDQQRIEEAAEDGIGAFTTTVAWRTADGRRRWLDVRARGWEDPDGQVLADVVLTDVTERTRAEGRTAISAAAHEALLGGGRLDAVLERVCTELAELYDLRGSWVGRADEDGTIGVWASAGSAGAVLDAHAFRWDRDPLPPAGAAIATAGVYATLAADLPHPAWREVSRALGIRAVLAVPLVVDGRPVGALTCTASHTELLEPEVQDELAGVAAWVALAVSLAESRDLTERQSAALAASADGVLLTDPDGTIRWVNDAFTRITGYGPAEAIGQTPSLLRSGVHPPAFYEELWRTVRSGETWRHEIVNRRRDGRLYVAVCTITPIVGPDGRISQFVGVQEDVTALREAQARAERLITHDPLTALPNRTLLLDRLDVALRGGSSGALLLVVLDLDGFGGVNALQGADAGDRLLVDVGRRLSRQVAPGDTVARLGADSFAVLCTRTGAGADTGPQVERLREALTDASGDTPGRGASMGVVVASTPAAADVTAEGLLRDAEIALQRAQSRRPGGYEYFDESLRDEVLERLQTGEQLKRAFAAGQFVVRYQPERDLDTGEIVVVEALVRWDHPELGLLAPGRFLAMVEQLGFGAELARLVRRAALADLARWRAALPGRPRPLLALNLPATELARRGVVEEMREDLRRAGISPGRVVLEVLERELVDATAAAQLVRLASIGVRIAIDDFGTGYSSLASLVSLPLDLLKIDRSFVSGLDRGDRRAGAVVAATIDLGHRLGLRVVAEGVETPAQRDVLVAFGCDLGQGHLFGPPVTADEVLALLRDEAAAEG